jgi:multidrug efflux pump subunit AcrA (membrane-fusion protein)
VNAAIQRLLQFACCAALAFTLTAAGDDDDDDKKPSDGSTTPALSAEQQHAVNLKIAHAAAAQAPERIAALGLVLDPSTLVSDESERIAASVQERIASADVARLRVLYQSDSSASLKMLESAQSDQARAHADATMAAARFNQRWGPLARQAQPLREKLLEALAAGHRLLVRADLPGRHLIGAMPSKAVLEVDGIEVPGRVLGALAQASELQSAGLLIEVRNPPAGLAPGARVPLSLYGEQTKGMLVPRDAVLYDEQGAYVYKQIAPKNPKEQTRYVPVKVTLLAPYGEGWLVQGIDDDDDIVVQGVGVLWSLQGVGAHPADDDEDED